MMRLVNLSLACVFRIAFWRFAHGKPRPLNTKVSKSPVWKLSGTTPMVQEIIIVKFEDDKDEQGRTPHRRVPACYVIPLPSEYFYEESGRREPYPTLQIN